MSSASCGLRQDFLHTFWLSQQHSSWVFRFGKADFLSENPLILISIKLIVSLRAKLETAKGQSRLRGGCGAVASARLAEGVH